MGLGRCPGVRAPSWLSQPPSSSQLSPALPDAYVLEVTDNAPTDSQKLNPKGKKIHGCQLTGIQEQLLVSQGRWPDSQKEPREGLIFADVANFQALASGRVAEMCFWRH